MKSHPVFGTSSIILVTCEGEKTEKKASLKKKKPEDRTVRRGEKRGRTSSQAKIREVERKLTSTTPSNENSGVERCLPTS